MDNEVKEILIKSLTTIAPGQGRSFIKAITALSNELLTIKNRSVKCKYKLLATWRFWTMHLESDLLVACFLANYSLEHPANEFRFDWKLVIDHDNEILNSILKQDIVDNHYHLGGSLPIFPSTWTYIMKENRFRNQVEHLLCLDQGLLERAAFIRHFFLQLLLENRIIIYERMDGQLLGIEQYYAERELIYCIIREFLRKNTTFFSYEDLFYEYITIKEKLRGLLVQRDCSVGVSDFFFINDCRNTLLNACGDITPILKSGISECLKYNSIDKMEIRISLKAPKDFYNSITLINSQIKTVSSSIKVKYIVCFSRRRSSKGLSHYRNQSKKVDLRNELKELSLLFEEYPSIAKEIAGIDVSSREGNYSPDVFSELMHNSIELINYPLKRMYHVGEEYTDLLTGLRRIDECLLFFELKANDRLGHAVPVYENVKQWYINQNYNVRLSKEEYLDNIVWLFCNLPLNIQSCPEAIKLQNIFSVVFKDLYEDVFNDKITKYQIDLQTYEFECKKVSINNYFGAWKLRKTEPEIIAQVLNEGNLTQDEALSYFIAYLYFYQKDVQMKGEQLIEVSISPEFISFIEIVQEEIQERIRDKGVCIEVCPSSNAFLKVIPDGYTHPVISLYEKYKTNSIIKDICVSINTDDMDVFSTSLTNEYSLIANAFEMNKIKIRDSNSDVDDFYDWLDRIRQNSIKMFYDDPELFEC